MKFSQQHQQSSLSPKLDGFDYMNYFSLSALFETNFSLKSKIYISFDTTSLHIIDVSPIPFSLLLPLTDHTSVLGRYMLYVVRTNLPKSKILNQNNIFYIKRRNI